MEHCGLSSSGEHPSSLIKLTATLVLVLVDGNEMMTKKKVVEFFSGIGGWSCALRKARGIKNDYEVVAAYDINPIANEVYLSNHHSPIPSTRSIDHIQARELDSYHAELWMMSPPCQPHTRNNTTEKRDIKDPRSSSFLHLLHLLTEMTSPPLAIILENVVGFEKSICCQEFLETVTALGYSTEQFILSPTAFAIPNARPRYYSLAWKPSSISAIETSKEILTSLEDGLEEGKEVQPLEAFLEDPSLIDLVS